MTTLDVARDLIAALDRNDADAVERAFVDGGTWWVDTGLDRAAGQFGRDPGPDRPWPLHGTMDAKEKAALLHGLPRRFPGGCRQHHRRSFAGGRFAVVEVEGDGLYRGERRYHNRYAFVVEVGDDGKVVELREYLDTEHAASVFDGKHLDRRTQAPPPADVEIAAATGAGEVALAFVARIAAGDPAGILALCDPGAAWWADGGRGRTPGPEAPAEVDVANPAKGKVVMSVRAPLVAVLAGAFPDGYRMVTHRLVEATGLADAGGAGRSGLVAAEVAGHGVHRSGAVYQNRYCFVIEVRDGSIVEVREYCDTRHGFDVLSGRAASAGSRPT